MSNLSAEDVGRLLAKMPSGPNADCWLDDLSNVYMLRDGSQAKEDSYIDLRTTLESIGELLPALLQLAEAVNAVATEDMCDSVRYLLVGMEQPGQTFGGIRQHCEWSGMDTSHWPDWTRGRDSEHFNKSARAALIWHCMYHAATVVRLVPVASGGEG